MQNNRRQGPGLAPPTVDRWTLLLCSFILEAAWGQMNCAGHQVLRVLAKDEEQLSLLRDLENLKTQKVDFWWGPARPSLPVDMRVPFSELDDIKADLESHGLVYSVMIKNVQELLDQEREAMAKAHQLERSTSSFSYSSYHTLEEIVSEYGKDHILTDILKVMDIFIELVTNPDGFALTHSTTPLRQSGWQHSHAWESGPNRLWRKNKSSRPGVLCTGVDLNRNWKSDFGGNGSNSNPCSETYHGPLPRSEPEVAAIVDFITGHGNFKALISIHSYSQMLTYPYGHCVEPISDQTELYNLAKDAVRAMSEVHRIKYLFGSISTTLYVATGVTVDWAYDNGIKYAFTFELRDTGRYGFLLPATQIIPTTQETWVAMRTIMEHTLNHPY
ncbi:Carboxypeptidase A5 [Fukomys damarensis]|uniref:Carboxypeptidase A5 n=1 Tax=Fukomys damarensis TaxID=885580 RepID=A0A091DE48_FUKDA|nr:Carboxypeptidase A5 [Fukomys damarensis]